MHHFFFIVDEFEPSVMPFGDDGTTLSGFLLSDITQFVALLGLMIGCNFGGQKLQQNK